MTTQIIKSGDSSFILSSLMPDAWSKTASVVVSVIDTGGNIIVDEAAAVRLANDTLSAAADGGDDTIVLTTGMALSAGDVLAVGSDAQGWQPCVVDTYTSATKTIILTELLEEDLAAGSVVACQNLTYDLDATVDGFDSISEVSVIWEPDGDGLAMTELWQVLTRQTQVAGFESEFQTAFPDLYSEIENDDFQRWHKRARSRLVQYFRSRQRDYNLIVDSELVKELELLQVAVLIGRGVSISDTAYERITKDFEEQLAMINNLDIWIDENEDSIKTDDETQKASAGFSRAL